MGELGRWETKWKKYANSFKSQEMDKFWINVSRAGVGFKAEMLSVNHL